MLSSKELKHSLRETGRRLEWMQENIEDAGERFVWMCNELGIPPDDCVELVDALIQRYENSDGKNIIHLVTATLWHGISLGKAAERNEHPVK